MFKDDVNTHVPVFLDSYYKFKEKYEYFYAPYDDDVRAAFTKANKIP